MLTKQGIDVSFAQGLDTKTDPKRVQIGKFLQLDNMVFDKGGLLQKRNGYGLLPSLPDSTYSYLTTFNGNATAIGTNIAALNSGGNQWVKRGSIQPLSVSTLPVIRNNLNQTACDAAIAPNGNVCTVYLETDGTTTTAKYAVADSVTGQNLAAPAVIPVASGTVTGGLRVFVLGSNFIIVFTNVITAVSHLQYVTVNINNPSLVGANTDIASSYVSATTLAWDGAVYGNNLYIAYNTTTGGQAIKVTYLSKTLTVAAPVSFATYKATMMSVTVDSSNPIAAIIYVSFYRSDTSVGYTLAVDTNLGTQLSPHQIISTGTYLNIASAAQNGVCTVFGEVSNTYSWGSPNTNYINTCTVTLATATVSSLVVSVRSVGLASKAFIVSGVIYYLGAVSSTYQPTYFLVNGSLSLSSAPVFAGKLAYQNGGGYLTLGLPGVSLYGTSASIAYLYKDLIEAVNKNTNVPSGTQAGGIYSQTGVNLGTFTIGTANLDTAEIGNDLHISGGFLWMYDGYLPVEHNFVIWPEDLHVTTATGSGGLIAQAYYYQATYEWTDNQGNAFRSAPSVPITITTTTGSSTNTIKVPTLRLTMKTANPVKIVLYRWSAAQQNYYQVTSISAPTLNDPTVDSVTITDAASDATILGNNLIYTTGGVVEDVNAPASDVMTLFDTRLWLVDAEDPNLLWYSKQIIEATPVEMSDLLTVYVPPTVGTASSTGPIKTIAVMDDKLILGKRDAFLYINGTGPDNTGANSQYSQPIFITATVGCANQKSIVLMPQGLMFQSDKGIWLLDRGLGTTYIGAPVQDFTLGATVTSAVNVPETNQVRFTLSTGVTLMYDYFYGQWGTFSGVPAISSCIFENLHTFINSNGMVYQETPGAYLDGSNPVLMKFQTGPLRLGDLQNYQRAYFFYILGEYVSPHKLAISLTYDYASAPSQSVIITPINYSTPYGAGASQSPYGQGDPYGGPASLESWRVFLDRQRCMAFAITLEEIFDPTFGTVAGAGLTISGLNVICAFKKAYRPQNNQTSVG